MKINREISYSELAGLVLLLEAERPRESDQGMVALAHVVCNRLLSGEHFSNICQDPDFVPEAGRGSYLDCRDMSVSLEVLGLIAEALSPDGDDPTDGALRFHRHDTSPDWASELEPSALIGGRFYYPKGAFP
ncbi:MAG: cell wall hydrolase [Pseudomonadota bacterium]